MLKKLLSIFILLAIFACSKGNPDAPAQVRIVDLNGKPKPIKKFVPEGNAQILANNQNSEAKTSPVNEKFTTNQPLNSEPISSDLAPIQTTTLAGQNPTSNNINRQETISYDLSNDQPIITKPQNSQNSYQTQNFPGKKFKLISASSSSKKVNSPIKKSGIFVQIGSFSISGNANKALNDGGKIFKGEIEEMSYGNKKSYRVVLGPIQDKAKASAVLKQVKNAGYADAFIVK